MTFEQWLGDRIETMSSHEYAAEKAAWEAGYLAGINDVPIAEYEPPEGYMLVPVESTEAMVDAGGEAYVHGGTIEAVYEAMIQAAQKGKE